MQEARERYRAAARWVREHPNFRRERDGLYFHHFGTGSFYVSRDCERSPRSAYITLLRQGGSKKCRRFYVRRARAIRLRGFTTTDVKVPV